MSGDKFNTEAEQGVDVVLGSMPAQDSAHTAPDAPTVRNQRLPQAAMSPPLPAQMSAQVPTPLTHTAEDTTTRDQDSTQGAMSQPYSSMPSQISDHTPVPTHFTSGASTGSQELPQGAMPSPSSPTPAQMNTQAPPPTPTTAADSTSRSQEPVQAAMPQLESSMPAQITAHTPLPTPFTPADSTGSQELPQAAMTPPFGSIPAQMNAQTPAPTPTTDGTFLPEGTRVRRRHVIERAEFTLPNGQGVNVTSESLLN